MGSAPTTAPSGQAGGINPIYAAQARAKTNGTPQFEVGRGAPKNTGEVPGNVTALTAGTMNSPFGPTGQKKTALGT